MLTKCCYYGTDISTKIAASGGLNLTLDTIENAYSQLNKTIKEADRNDVDIRPTYYAYKLDVFLVSGKSGERLQSLWYLNNVMMEV